MPSTTNASKTPLVVMLLFLVTVPLVRPQESKDLDNYKWRVDGSWWFSQPSGYFGVRNSNNYFDIHHDFGFGSYSTFTGKIDWHFGRKHHFLFNASPVNSSRTRTLSRTIEFQGQTFDLGTRASTKIRSLNLAPGYQYDVIRRDRGFLGLEVDFNLLDTKASINGTGTVNGHTASRSASKSFFAPLPAVGPVFRWYPLPNSNRLSLDGSLRGISFFGYGNFVSSRGSVGIGLTQHLAFRGGYQLGSRLSIHGTSDEVAIQATQKGPTAGLEYSWGQSPVAKRHEPASNPYAVSDWHVEWVPFYLWFSGLRGSVGAQGNVVPVNASFSDIFSQLNIGLMSVLDVRHRRIGLLTDLVFISLTSDQKSTPVGTLYSGFTANAKTFFVDPEVYFRLGGTDQGSVDVVAGARIWRLDNSVNLLQGSATAVSAGQTQSWEDPVVGARLHLNFKKSYFFNLKGDAGGFGVGSQQTWQVYGGLGKEFAQKYSMQVGYRYLYVDYINGGFLFNVHMSGPLAGFAIRFK